MGAAGITLAVAAAGELAAALPPGPLGPRFGRIVSGHARNHFSTRTFRYIVSEH